MKSGPQNVPEMTPSASSFCAGSVEPSVVDVDSSGTLPSSPACLYWRTKLTPRPPGIEHVDGVGILGGDLRELGGEVGLVQRRVDLVDDLALVDSA